MLKLLFGFPTAAGHFAHFTGGLSPAGNIRLVLLGALILARLRGLRLRGLLLRGRLVGSLPVGSRKLAVVFSHVRMLPCDPGTK